MILHDAVIAAAKKRDAGTGLYKDWLGNIWQVQRIRNLDTKEVTWRAEMVFPFIVEEEEP